MARWPAFLEICSHLRAGLLGAPPVETCKAPWESAIEVSNLQLVSPAIAWCVRHRADVPADVAEYLDSLYRLNCRREQAILAALEIALRGLRARGIEAILLKGSAHVVEGLYPPGTRLLGDVDMLFAPGDADRAFDTLVQLGYDVSTEVLPADHRHLPVLLDRTSGLSVELHTRLEQEIDNPVIPLSWFMAKTRLMPFRGMEVRLPDATRLVAHNFLHHRVNDISRGSPVELRWLVDAAVVRARHADAIDWGELDRFAHISGQGEVLATYLAFGETLLGQICPPLAVPPEADACRKLREYIDPSLRRPGPDIDVVSYRFFGAAATHVAGHCWRVALPDAFLPGDVDSLTRLSSIDLSLGGKQLGPAFTARTVIERVGQGCFAHRGRELLFSTPDNGDPRASRDPYVAKGWVPASADLLGTIERLGTERAASSEALEQVKAENHSLREALERTQEENRSLVELLRQINASAFWRVRLRLERYERLYALMRALGAARALTRRYRRSPGVGARPDRDR